MSAAQNENNEAQIPRKPNHNAVYIRYQNEAAAMGWDDRIRLRLRNHFSKKCSGDISDNGDNDDDCDDLASGLNSRSSSVRMQNEHRRSDKKPTNETSGDDNNIRNEKRKSMQYRFEPPEPQSSWTMWRRVLTINGLLAKIDKSPNSNRETSFSSPWFEVTGKASYYLHCIFRADPLILFLSMCASFFGLAFIFSILIVIAGTRSPDCVRVGGELFNAYGAAFGDAFALSWVTLRYEF
jgi:hypothetical protein